MPWQFGPFMVPGNDENRDVHICYFQEGFISLIDNRRGDFASEKKVPSMNDQVDLPFQGKIQDIVVIGEEVLTPPPTVYSWTNGEIKSQMGIGEKEDLDYILHGFEAW
jgi:hypothetical protein